MDFELPEEHLAFRDVVRRWVDSEVPKDWARKLELDEHNYPFALWDKFTQAGFHGVGIPKNWAGRAATSSCKWCAPTGPLAGRAGVDLGHHLVCRLQVHRTLREQGTEGKVSPGYCQWRSEGRHRFYRAGGWHRPARRRRPRQNGSKAAGNSAERRFGAAPRMSPTICW